jgi:hypothetical protein
MMTRNKTGMSDGKLTIQSFSSVGADNLLVAFYDIHGKKGEVLFVLS